MVTLLRAAYQTAVRVSEYAGLSGDVKPMEDVENGAWYTEIDTGKKFRFDMENSQWIEQP